MYIQCTDSVQICTMVVSLQYYQMVQQFSEQQQPQDRRLARGFDIIFEHLACHVELLNGDKI